MIESFYINGFRSLIDFKIDLKRGLNVIVGPNGAGKTNIVDAIVFIANLANHDLHASVSKAGGSQAIFSDESSTEEYSKLDFRIAGVTKFPKDSRVTEAVPKYIQYDYEATILLDKVLSRLAFERQRITIRFLETRSKLQKSAKEEGEIDIDFEEILTSSGVQFKVNHVSNLAVKLERYFDRNYRLRKERRGEENLNKAIERFLRGFLDLSISSSGDQSMLRRFYNLLLSFRAVKNDVASISILNINPQRAKAPNDIASSFGIGPDGFGLATTIFRLAKIAEAPNFLPHQSDNERAERLVLSQIQKYTTQVNKKICRVYAKMSPDYTQHVGFVEIDLNGSSHSFPLAKVSDGTAKWIALVTYIETKKNNFIIEEPENFLHPEMQRYLLSIIRENPKVNEGAIILSTHSETLLNECRPQEIILINFDAGRTTAKRIRNPKHFQTVINETGFGLGYFYANSTIDA